MGRDFFNHKMGLHVKLWDVCHSHRSRLLHQKINSWCLFVLLIWSVSCKDIKQLSFDSQLLKLQVFQKITISNEICKVWNQIISNCHITNFWRLNIFLLSSIIYYFQSLIIWYTINKNILHYRQKFRKAAYLIVAWGKVFCFGNLPFAFVVMFHAPLQILFSFLFFL